MKLVKELPEIFEEFEDQKKKSFLEIKEKKEQGIPVIGTYCNYFPMELAIAIGAVPCQLCAYSNSTIPAAEKELPKSVCPLIKSSYGYAIEDKCPVFHFSDLVVGETTCDGKKKMFELLSEKKPVFVMEIPNSQSKEGLKFWEKEIIRTKEYLEEFFNVVITDEKLRAAIHMKNEMRNAIKRVSEVMKNDPAPVYGESIQKLVSGAKHRFDYQSVPDILDSVTEKIMQEYQEGKMLEHRPRILITGCPIGGDTLEIIRLIEKNGGVVVAMDNCSGAKAYTQMVDEDNPNVYEALAKGYLAIGCSIMTPNDNRIELIGQLIDEYRVDGVVELILTGCHSTGVESVYIRKFVNQEKNLPYIAIDTDYASVGSSQVETRIAAFVEMIAVEKDGCDQIDINYCYKLLFSGIVHEDRIEDILEKLYAYTRIPVVIIDEAENEIYFTDDKTKNEWKNWDEAYIVEEALNENGRCIGKCVSAKMRGKIKELMEIIARSYGMHKHTASLNEKEMKLGRPDYLWILEDEKTEELMQVFQDKFTILERYEETDYQGILLSGIKGREHRERIIDLCNEYAEEKIVQMVVGNGFQDLKKQEDNRKLLERVFFIGQESDPWQQVYLIEDYYHKIAISFVAETLDKTNYQIDELEKIKAEDKEKDSQLYETLYWYLMMNRNAMQTAARLQIHRNTLLGRISRINEIINISDKTGAECERMLLAMELENSNKKVMH